MRNGIEVNSVKPTHEMPFASFYIDDKVVSESNRRDHWSVASKRHASQRANASILTVKALRDLNKHTCPRLPIVVILTLFSRRALDSDNLAGAFKHVRDGITDGLRIVLADKPRDDADRIEWVCKQSTTNSKKSGYRAVIFNVNAAALENLIKRKLESMTPGHPDAGKIFAILDSVE